MGTCQGREGAFTVPSRSMQVAPRRYVDTADALCYGDATERAEELGMFPFGHVGLTWGGALLLVKASRRLPASGPRRPTAGSLDYRLLILGSMLPDLIDKPLGVFLLRKQLSNGRIFAHSLLFTSLVGLASLALRGRARRALVPVTLGSAAHLVLDHMWTQTNVLLWPLRGWRPERRDVSHWLEQMLDVLVSDPYTYISEAAGAGAITAILTSLLKRRGLSEFIKSGWMRAGLDAGEKRPQQMKRR